MKSQIIAKAPRYNALTLPFEIIHGIEDTVVSPELRAKALERDAQNAHLMLLEGVGQMPHHIARQAVKDAIGRATERSGLHLGRK